MSGCATEAPTDLDETAATESEETDESEETISEESSELGSFCWRPVTAGVALVSAIAAIAERTASLGDLHEP